MAEDLARTGRQIPILLLWAVVAGLAVWFFWPQPRPPDPQARLDAIQATRNQISADRIRRSADIQATQLELPADVRAEILAVDRETEAILRDAEDELLRDLDREEREILAAAARRK